MAGIYSFNSPLKLFDKLTRDFFALYKNPSEDGIFSVVFSLYHLREWICPGITEKAVVRIRAKPGVKRTDAE